LKCLGLTVSLADLAFMIRDTYSSVNGLYHIHEHVNSIITMCYQGTLINPTKDPHSSSWGQLTPLLFEK